MIDDLREKADGGDAESQETLRSAGLWQTEEEAAEEYAHWTDAYADETGEEFN
jgi:hypothetical protein